MNISIDIDGVLADFIFAFVATINRLWPNRLPPDYQQTSWWFSEVMTRAECDKAFAAFCAERNSFLKAKSLAGSEQLRAYLPELMKQGINVYYITARAKKAAGAPVFIQTNKWLKQEGLIKENTSLIVVEDGGEKARLNASIKAAFSLDDKPSTVSECNMNVPNHQSYLLDQAWNRTDPSWAFMLPRVQSVKEFLDLVLVAAQRS